MSVNIEIAIRDLLINSGQTNSIAEILFKRLEADPQTPEDRETIIHFFINSGHYVYALKLFSVWFKNKIPLPLSAFCFLLHTTGFIPNEAFLKFIFKSIKKLNLEDAFSHFTPWEQIDPSFAEFKVKKIESLKNAHESAKAMLIEKLEFLRSHRMIEEERKLLAELVKKYPGDNSFFRERKDFEQRWAQSVIARKTTETFDKIFTTDAPIAPADELKIANVILSTMKDYASTKPRMAYNFAIALYFMDLFEHALEVLHYAPPSAEVDWLEVELLLKSRRFVEGLDAIHHAEDRYAQNPETTFGATYYRALALAGLGRLTTAIELLKSIVNIRPSYRSAQSLLYKWGGSV